MKSFAIIGLAVGAVLAGCASTSGARSAPTTSAAPAHPHDDGDGDQAGMMAGMCPMQVPGTTVAATEVEGGIDLAFTTTSGDVAELRQRVRRMAEMHNRPGGHMKMGSHGAPAPGADAKHQHGARAGDVDDSGGGGKKKMMGGGMMMPAATASAEDVEGGARLSLQPKDPAQLAALREHVRMKAQRMADGECPMMSSGGEPAPLPAGDADHDAHQQGK